MGFISVKMECIKFVVVLTAVMVVMSGSAVISFAEYVSDDLTKNVADAGSSDIGYVVLVAGDDDGFWDQHAIKQNIEDAYQALSSLGFDDERILYLNSDSSHDADGDGDNDVDRSSSLLNFKDAIGWASERTGDHSPFILYMVGHGSEDRFYIGETTYVSPSDEPSFPPLDSGMELVWLGLDYWLGELPTGTRMLIIIDACYSGSFITPPDGEISAPNRVIITSSHDDSTSDTVGYFGSLFSHEFWQYLGQGKNVKEAFINGTQDANYIGMIAGKYWDPWLDDNGDAAGHSPLFLGDDGELAATMIIGVPGAPPSVGESASDPSLFEDCYDRNGGASKLGDPINKVHRWGTGYIQDFHGGEGYEGAIMQPDGVNYTYAVYGAIWSKYLVLGGAEGSLEYPLNDESDLPSSSISGAECRYNKFDGGGIVHHATGPDAGLTVFLGHGIFSKWEELNYGESALGLSTSDEGEASQSGAEGFDTTGVVCDFEGGHICWHRTGEYNDKAFETHGAIDGTYHGEGGSGSWLGFPTNEEYKDSETSYARSDFEGGYITTPDGIDYYASPYDLPTPTPTPTPTSKPSPIIIEDADTIWNASTSYSSDLINVACNVTPRIVMNYAKTVYRDELNEIPTDLSNLTNEMLPKIIIEYANSNYCRDLIFPEELINDTTPPLIAHTPVTSATESEPIPISATITDSGGIASATLFYRITGATWTSLSMTSDVNIYTASIPASSVTTAGVEYYIKAINSYSDITCSPETAPATPYSITVTFKIDTANPPAPSPDDGVTGWSTDNTPTFNWSTPSDTSGIAGYYWKVDSGSETWITTTSVTLSAQSDGTRTFHVRAKDNAGNIGDFGSHEFTIDRTKPSSHVTELSPTQTTTSFTVSWTGSDTGGSGLKWYDVQYKDGSGGTWTDWETQTASTSATFGPINPITVQSGHTYYFQSRAQDTAGNWETYPGGDVDTHTTISMPDTNSIITISAEPSTINISESITISGNIIPAHSAIVTLTFTPPAGATIEQPVLSTISGAYRFVFPANEDGTWLVNATWAGDADHTGNTSETIPFNVASTEIDVGYAIIIAGRNDEGLSQPYIDLTANATYKTLLKRGFTVERICYLNPSADQDANGDGVSDVDMISSLTNVSYAINTWAEGNVGVDVPLLIYMVDHGGNDTFLVNGAANTLTASDLNGYLNELTADTGCHDIVVVYEACSGGSFVDDLSATGRIIVTSTGIDADAGIDNTGAFFSKYFFKGISDGKTIKEAFEDASNAPEIIAYSQLLVSFGLPPQTPLLDDNGDAMGHAIPLAGTGDGSLAASGYIGTQWGALDFPPTITGAIRNQNVAVGTSIDIWAVVVDDSTIDDVYATIIEPSYSISDANDTLFEMNTTTVYLEDPDADGNYTASFTLTESGNYTVIVHATDSEGNIASPKQCTITSTARGDVNGDCELTSADAALALQLAVNGQYSNAADVNRDGSVTSLDALMIMQACAGKIEL